MQILQNREIEHVTGGVTQGDDGRDCTGRPTGSDVTDLLRLGNRAEPAAE